MAIRNKFFICGKGFCSVALKKEGQYYIVEVNGTVYKNTPNELFAIQTFNEI